MFVPAPELSRRVASWTIVNLMASTKSRRSLAADRVLQERVHLFFAAAISRVVDQFAASMPAPGYLCVGASESLLT